jgi:hypothetical protein
MCLQELAQKAEEARNESLLHMQSKEAADQELQRFQKEIAVMQRTCEHLQKELHGTDLKRKVQYESKLYSHI